jgi:hypothetical protein
MILCDTGPLVAAFNKADDDHARSAPAIGHRHRGGGRQVRAVGLRTFVTLLVNTPLPADVKSGCLAGGDPRRLPAVKVARRRWLPSLRTKTSAFAAAWPGWPDRAPLAGTPPSPVPLPAELFPARPSCSECEMGGQEADLGLEFTMITPGMPDSCADFEA